VLVYTIATVTIISLALLAYLTLIREDNHSTQRSQCWNECVAVMEAGIEDALTHLNSSGVTNLAVDGWTASGGQYSLQRVVASNYYIVSISTSVPPVITATGFVQIPLFFDKYVARAVECDTRRQGIFSKAILAKESIDLRGNNVNTDSFISSDPAYSTNGRYDPNKKRAHGDVATNSGVDNMLNVGNADIAGHISTGPGGDATIGANGTVGDLSWVSGHSGIETGFSADDMNVSFPDVKAPFSGGAYTPTGGYVTNTTTTVLTNHYTSTTLTYPSGNDGAVTTNALSSSTNYPTGSPGPVTTSVVTNTTAVTSQTYPAAGSYVGTVTTNIVSNGQQSERGTWYNYTQIDSTATVYNYPTFTASYATYTTNAANSVTYYDTILDSGNYQIGSLSGSVLVRGSATLLVTDSLNISGSGGIYIQSGASLSLYVSAPSATIAGNGVVNYNSSPNSFYYFGMPTNTKVSLSGNSQFTGGIYAPNADFTLGGGGKDVYDFVGSIAARSMKMNGHYNIHYDEAMEQSGPVRIYVVVSWNEL
jgi:hypothetical protein